MKRGVMLILLLLVTGAIVNVAVAWGCASFSPPREHTSTTVDNSDPHIRDHPLLKSGEARLHSVEDVVLEGFGSTWSAIAYRIEIPPGDPYPVIFIADVLLESGWPNGALSKTARLEVTKGWDGESVTLDWPTRPIWPGFAINTVFYAFILWGLFAAPFALRRRRRIKRGLCPKCAYPVGSNQVCTECGAAVSVSRLEPENHEHDHPDADSSERNDDGVHSEVRLDSEPDRK